MILTHYPNVDDPEAWEFDPSVVYDNTSVSLKPNGLWLSLDDGPDIGWADWCAENLPSLNHQVGYNLDVDVDRCFVVDSVSAAVEFSDRYAMRLDDNLWFINWASVVDDYSGVFAPAYIRTWSALMSNCMLWYYAWDCASAVVCDLSTVHTKPYVRN